MSEAFDASQQGLLEHIAMDGGSFVWKGATYGAILNHETHVLVTSKSFFAGRVFPPVGATILINGKERQVKKMANSGLELVAGGLREDVPFVDDAADPALEIEYGSFTK
jgi:hypothetical protein